MKSEGAGCVKQKWESKRVERRKKGKAKEEEIYGGFIAEEMIQSLKKKKKKKKEGREVAIKTSTATMENSVEIP